MHLGSLPGLIVAVVWGLLGGTPAQHDVATGISNGHNSAALYSIVAQAATPTITTGTTGTTAITSTATLEVTATATGLVTATATVSATGSVIATETVSATGTITSGAALTQTVTAPTTIPLPTQAPQQIQPSLQINPFDWNFLTSEPRSPNIKIGPFAWVFLVLMLGLIVGGIYGYRVQRPRWKNTNTVWYRAVGRFGQPALWIGVLGILFLFFRVVELNFFNMRLWLYLIGLAFLGLAGWFFYWYRNQYPQEMAKFQKTQKARQYAPGGGKGPVRPTGPSVPVAPQKGNKGRRRK
jgi:hypothetical protein